MSSGGGRRRLLIRDLGQLATPAGRGAPLRGADLARVDLVEDAYVLCEDGVIASVGRMRDLSPLPGEVDELDARGLCAVPGLVEVFGELHAGDWYDIGTIERLNALDAQLSRTAKVS